MERITGITEWFATKNESYGYIEYGEDKHIFVHYKNIEEQNQRDPNHREVKKGDIVSFVIGEGYHTNGTQALEVRIESVVVDDYRDERDR